MRNTEPWDPFDNEDFHEVGCLGLVVVVAAIILVIIAAFVFGLGR